MYSNAYNVDDVKKQKKTLLIHNFMNEGENYFDGMLCKNIIK